MSDGRSDTGMPRSQPERIEWLYKCARGMDLVRDEDWIENRLEWLWNHPNEFARGETPEPPEGVAEEDYRLFQLGLLFGTDYEHEFPRSEYDGN